jgi:hypothetical protein
MVIDYKQNTASLKQKEHHRIYQKYLDLLEFSPKQKNNFTIY